MTNMKYLMQRLFFIISLLTIGACSDDEVETPNYYVKYEVFAEPNDKMTIYYMDEYSHMKFVQETLPTGHFEHTVGPVKSGYKAAMIASREGNSGASGTSAEKLQISVSLAGEPYVVKQSGKHYYKLTYQIF